MNSKVTRIVSVILGLFALSYIGYQAFKYFNKPYVTETALPYSVAESLTLEGVAVRDEQVIRETVSGGVLRYSYDDASRVAAGETIAKIFANKSDIASENKINTLQQQIYQLQKAQEQGKSMNSYTDALSGQITEQQNKIIRIMQGRMLDGLQKEKLAFTALLNSKMIALGQEDNFETLITQMQADKQYLERSHGSETGFIKAPQGGYFVKNTDGLESKINPDDLNELDYDKYLQMLENVPENTDGAVGKIMFDHIWYFVVKVTDRELEKFTNVESVELDFNLSDTAPIKAEVYNIITNRPDKNLVVFKCKNITDELLNMRYETVNVIFRHYSGYRVSTDAIRFVDGQECVYVMDHYQIKLVPIYIVYRQNSFVLCDPNAMPIKPPEEEKEGLSLVEPEKTWINNKLRMFDEVIVEGVDLHDGKSTA